MAQLEREDLVLMALAVGLQPAEQQLHSGVGHLPDRLRQGRQRRIRQFCPGWVIDGHERNVGRDTQLRLLDSVQGAYRHEVVGDEQGGGTLREEFAGSPDAAGETEIAKSDQGPKPTRQKWSRRNPTDVLPPSQS